jgi:outer membrane immunogenic protein
MNFRFSSTIATVSFSLLLSTSPARSHGLKDNPWDGSATSTSWSGTYVGVHGGGSSGSAKGYSTVTGGGARLDLDGGVGGVAIGHNWTMSGFVVSVEADATFGDLTGRRSYDLGVVPGYGSFTGRIDNEMDNIMSLRMRVGIPAHRALIYATAGLAYGEYTLRGTLSDGTSSVSIAQTDDAVGVVVGGGVDWKLTDRWGLRAEALHYMWNDVKLIDPLLGGFEIDASSTVVRGALTYGLN